MTEGPSPPSNQVFREPWHAQLFAITIALHESGVMSWTEWTDMLAKEIAARKPNPGSDSEDEHYGSWQAALERLLQSRNLVGGPELSAALDRRKAEVTAVQEELRNSRPG